MVRGPRKHLKRLNAPHHWMLDKLGGVFAPKPVAGPHKFRESLPLILLLRNRLKYALTKKEVKYIMKQRAIKVDGKVRTESRYPAGFMDVINIEKTNENFRLLYNTKGRFTAQPISAEEAKFKLCKVKKIYTGVKGIPYAALHDGRTLRYPDPAVKAHDTIKFDLTSGKGTEVYKFEVGALVMCTGGRNLGRIGVIVHRERHPGSFDIVHIRDAIGQTFATRLSNIFVIGKEKNCAIALPKAKGVKRTVVAEFQLKHPQQAAAVAESSTKA
jgi:small subunit ribosomal protein S4e